MFFFQRNSSPLFFISRCSSLSLLFSLSFASPFRLLSHFLCLSLSFFSKFVNMTINLSLIAQLSRGKLPIRENLVITYVLLKNVDACVPIRLFFFLLPLFFNLLTASISRFLNAVLKFSCFSSNEIRHLYFSSLVVALCRSYSL